MASRARAVSTPELADGVKAAIKRVGLAPPERFRWLRGEEKLRSYKIPEAARFSQTFCETCGSVMPVVRPDQHRVVIPAGSLDNDPGGRERAHIFCGSKSHWYEISDDLEQFEEYSNLL